MKDFESYPPDRNAAISAGEPKFFTGRPCNKGHVTYRYTISGACAQCMSEKQKQKMTFDKKRFAAAKAAREGKATE